MSTGEITDIFNEDGEVIGTMLREEAERDNHITKNVVVFVFTSSGKAWIQKRPMTKKHYPGLWDVSACGTIHSGENPHKAAEREQKEEMGFVSKLKEVEAFINVFPDESGKVVRTRLSHLFVGISQEIPKPNDEVEEFAALPYEELRRKITAKPEEYIPSFLIELDKAVAAYRAMS